MVSSEGAQSRAYIPAIDGLRAIAVGSVLLYHLRPGLLPGGFTGVDIFFVISGFVVTGSMIGREFTGLKAMLAFFYARRLVRIMPALLAMLLVAVLATQLFVPDAWLSRSVMISGTTAFAGLSNMALAFDPDTYFAPRATFNPFLHTWSLGVEEQFYLLFPFLIWGHLNGGRRVVRLVSGLAVASLVLCAVLSVFAPRLAFFLMPARFWELGLGMALRLTQDRWVPLVAQRGWIALPAVAAIAAGFAIPSTPGFFPFPAALLPALGSAALILLACAAPRSPATRMLATRPMVMLGKFSYSLYLWHWPVIVLMRWTSGLETLEMQALALGLSLALSIASYALIEQPLRTSQRLASLPRGAVVRRMLAASGLAMVAGLAMFLAHDRLTLSVTGNRAEWYAEGDRAVPGARCDVRQETKRVEGGDVTTWTPQGCASGGFAIYTIGDSHNLAYAPDYRRLAAELGVPVQSWYKSGCAFARLNAAIPGHGDCGRFTEVMLDRLTRAGKPGDVVFLPGLRIMRLANQLQDPDTVEIKPSFVPESAIVEADALLARLSASGMEVLFEAPKPVFPSPTFRCSDWFNRGNPICAGGLSIARAEIERRRAPVIVAIARLAAHNPRVRSWDPLPLLCPAPMCEAVHGGRPLFFDGDHLSGHGNDVLYPGLRDAILASRVR